MGQIIEFPTIREGSVVEERRRRLIAELEKLIWQDLDAMHQLDDYCHDRRNMVDDRVKKILVEKGILTEDGELPDLTNEAMYELRTGQKPFWL